MVCIRWGRHGKKHFKMCYVQSVRREPFRTKGTEGTYWSLIKRTVEKEGHLTFYLGDTATWSTWVAKMGLLPLVVLTPALVCATDPKLNASHQGLGWLEMIVDSLCCDKLNFHQRCRKQSCSPLLRTRLPQNINRAGEIAILCLEIPQTWECAKGIWTKDRSLTTQISTQFHLRRKASKSMNGGEKNPYGLYFDFYNQIVEITDRLNKIICFGAAGSFKGGSLSDFYPKPRS